jgi:hypothetical protein
MTSCNENKLRDLECDINWYIDEIAHVERDINEYGYAGYTGFQDYQTYFTEEEKNFIASEVRRSFEDVEYLKVLKMELEDLRKEYTNLSDAINIARHMKNSKVFVPTYTEQMFIEDSDVFDESAFGPEIYVM